MALMSNNECCTKVTNNKIQSNSKPIHSVSNLHDFLSTCKFLFFYLPISCLKFFIFSSPKYSPTIKYLIIFVNMCLHWYMVFHISVTYSIFLSNSNGSFLHKIFQVYRIDGNVTFSWSCSILLTFRIYHFVRIGEANPWKLYNIGYISLSKSFHFGSIMCMRVCVFEVKNYNCSGSSDQNGPNTSQLISIGSPLYCELVVL